MNDYDPDVTYVRGEEAWDHEIERRVVVLTSEAYNVYGGMDWHPNDETIAAFVDSTLADPDYIRVNDHLNYCPRCYEIVSETREALRTMREEQTAQDEVREEYQELYRQIAGRTHDD